MAIEAAFMVPHPPLIVPAVGQGGEEQIRETSEAYDTVARQIAQIEPETIIIATPHSVMYQDYFHISPGSTAHGDLGAFRAPQVSFDETYDEELVSVICDYAEDIGLQAGTLGERDASLDHGTMIPLYFIEKYYKGAKIVRIGLSGQSYESHYELGMIIQAAADTLGRRAVFVASGDLSHKLQEYGPYGFAEEGPQYDERIMDVCGRAAFGELFDFDEDFCDKAAECGHRSFVMMAGALDCLAVRAEKLSHQDVTGVGYGICSYHVTGPDKSRDFLMQYIEQQEAALNDLDGAMDDLDGAVDDPDGPLNDPDGPMDDLDGTMDDINRLMDDLEQMMNQVNEFGEEDAGSDEAEENQISDFEKEDAGFHESEEPYVRLARASVEAYVSGRRKIGIPAWAPREMLDSAAGVFVSIHEFGDLRGCIGTILPFTDCIAEEIISNAISACSRDPRFEPVSPDELDNLEISVDVLTEPEPISGPEQLDVRRYGVIVSCGGRRGLLLPDLEGVDTVPQQIDIARRKGGIGVNEPYKLERFEVIRHS